MEFPSSGNLTKPMQCTCVRQTDLPNTSKLYSDLVYNFDRVKDLYPWPPNDLQSIAAAARFDFPPERRAALVRALAPLNEGNPSLAAIAREGTVAIVTGQQVGLFSGPAYTVYKALTAIRIASDLSQSGIPAVPVFWLATEDHDFAEVNHAWVFGADLQPRRLEIASDVENGHRPVGGLPVAEWPIEPLREALGGLPFAEDALALVSRAYAPGATMGSAFAQFIRELFAPYGLLIVDPMTPGLRELAAPSMAQAVELMPELIPALERRGRELVERGYHAQVLVDGETSLVFLLENGKRISLRRSNGDYLAQTRRISASELAANGARLSPNALLRPVAQDFMLPAAAYVGGPAELAYLAQSQVLYDRLLGRQPVAFPRAGFTLLDERSHKKMERYGVAPANLLTSDRALLESIAGRLIPPELRERLDDTRTRVSSALDALSGDLHRFDVTLAAALETSRRKIEYQIGKIARKTASEIMNKDEQARRDALALHGLVFPEKHLQERLYSIVPLLAKFGPGLIGEIYDAVRIECPDHQFAIV
jgi:bacillithiol biosynthesis cysteine-adding enzyme BshC